jgi:uncharacterized Zn finger protein
MRKIVRGTKGSPARTAEINPCPRCGKDKGEVKERRPAKFPFYVICHACGFVTSSTKIRGVAVKLWNEARTGDGK